MTLLLVQKDVDDGVMLLLFFTDLQVEDLKECFEIAVDIFIELVQLTEQLWNCWHIESFTADAVVIHSPPACIVFTP